MSAIDRFRQLIEDDGEELARDIALMAATTDGRSELARLFLGGPLAGIVSLIPMIIALRKPKGG